MNLYDCFTLTNAHFNTVASKNDLHVHSAIEELKGFDMNWQDLGTLLSLDDFYLDSIECGNYGVGTKRDALMMVLDVWLRKDPGASWEKLADAVEKCGYTTTAKNIRKKGNISSTGI